MLPKHVLGQAVPRIEHHVLAVVQLILHQKTCFGVASFPAALFSLEDGSTTAKRPRRHPTWRRPVPVWRSRTRRHGRLDAYAGPDPSQALPGESFSMGPKRKRPPSGVLILTTGRTDQIAPALVLADLLLMGWSARAPALPAREAGRGRSRQGARHVSETRHLARRNRHRYRQELVPHRWPESARG